MNPEKFASLLSIIALRLAEVKATQEIVLKAQATFLATLSNTHWEPIFEDLRAQAREASAQYAKQVLDELLQQLGQEPPKN